MASGLPDWSKIKTALDFKYSNDIAELAARLGSPARYYRSGNIIVFSSFEDGDDYFALQAVGASAICAASTTKALSGAKSLKMSLANTDTSSIAFKNIPYHSNGIIALSFAIDVSLLTNKFTGSISVTSPDYFYLGKIILDKANNSFKIMNNAASEVSIATFATKGAMTDHQWMSVKLFMDMANERYYEVDINTIPYDLTSYPLYKVAASTREQVQIALTLTKPSAGTDTVYVDNVIYTINDPS